MVVRGSFFCFYCKYSILLNIVVFNAIFIRLDGLLAPIAGNAAHDEKRE